MSLVRYPGPRHLSLARTEALVPVLPQVRAADAVMARQLRRTALDYERENGSPRAC